VVAHRADAAEALDDDRQLPERAALDEALEASELDDVQPRLFDLAASSSRIVTLPCPSTRVTGSMTTFFVVAPSSVVLDQLVGKLDRACR
jgi:hypothetical protein